jgi:hypothetical protein
MSYNEDIMYWYKNCGHEITLIQNNKSEGYTAIATCKDTKDTFKVSDKEIVNVLHTLKCMLNGVYYG